MNKYEGPERRQRSDFEREQIEFMAEMREHMRNQAKRCDSHSADIRTLDSRTTIIEQAIQLDPDGETIGQRTVSLEHSRVWVLGGAAALSAVVAFGYAALQLWRFSKP